MTRYLIGRRASGARPPNLVVTDKPPGFYQPKSPRGEPEHVTWGGTSYGWRVRRGVVQEWPDKGAMVIARIFPEEFAVELANIDATIALARSALEQTQRERQELLDTIAARAKPVRVAEAKKER